VRVGDRVVLGGRVGIADHRTIGDDAVVTAASAVGQDVPPQMIYAGYPAGPLREKLQEQMNLRRLTRLLREMVEYGKRLATLERRLGSSSGG